MNPIHPLPGPPPGARPGPPPGAVPPPDVQSSPSPAPTGDGGNTGTGHPAVDAVLRSLANAVPLSPADQIAEYEAAHRVLQETLAGIDQS